MSLAMFLLAYSGILEGYFPKNFGEGTVPVERVYAAHRNYIMGKSAGLSYREQKARIIFFQSLAGIVARNSRVRLYIIGATFWETWLKYVEDMGIPVDYTYDEDNPDTLWKLAGDMKSYTSGGYLKCDVMDASVNWATSLSAKYNTPVVDESIAEEIENAGYTLLKTFDEGGTADYTTEDQVWNEWSQ